jgi:hypothetical protein
VRKLVELAQLDHLTILRWQGSDEGLQHGREAAPDVVILRYRDSVLHCFGITGQGQAAQALSLARAQVVVGCVASDLRQPCAEPLVVSQGIPMSPDAYENLLDDIVDVGVTRDLARHQTTGLVAQAVPAFDGERSCGSGHGLLVYLG